MDRPPRRRRAARAVVRRSSCGSPAAVADDPGDLPARPRQVRPSPLRGQYRIGRIPAEEIENWLNDELAAGLAPSSVHRHYRTLRRVLPVAVQKQRLLTNPCDRVDPPKIAAPRDGVPRLGQAVRLAEAHSERFRSLIYLAVDSGMRWGELVGLRRRSVDVDRAQGQGHRTARPARGRARGSAGHRRRRAACVRSRSRRRWPSMLERAHRAVRAAGTGRLVFPNAAGHPLS